MQLDGIKFRRQEPIGQYIVDFVSYERKLIVEVDGSQHTEASIMEKDEQRTKWLESQGFVLSGFGAMKPCRIQTGLWNE